MSHEIFGVRGGQMYREGRQHEEIRLPGLRLDPAAEDLHIHGLIFRSAPNLPVRFDPA